MNFSTENLNRVFAEVEYDGFRNLMFDVASGNKIFDEDGIEVSSREANDKIRSVVFNILGINEKSTKRDRKRAMKKHGAELFEVIEEVIDVQLASGFKDSEFFNEFVDMRNLAMGDSQEFWTNDKTILSVAKVSGSNHDITLQKLGEGSSYTVSTSTYAIAVGADIDMYLTGRIDWTKLTEACAKAFVNKVQGDMYAEVMAAGSSIPSASQFTKTMALNATNKDTFDTLIEDVQTANDNAPVYIMGTKTALKKLNALADVDWATLEQKSQMAEMGRLGTYEGVTLVEIPQRFKENDTATKLVDSTKLLIMPQSDNRFVKFVDVGETEILEVTEKGARMDDTMKYEVQREMGIATRVGKYFGVWTIA